MEVNMRLAHITWKKAEEYFKSNDTVLIAIGSIENHGTHLALGTDTLIPNKILEIVEKKVDVMIAPTIPYGACDSMTDFPGTISIGYDGLLTIITKITDCLFKFGVRKFVFLNGHGGNISALETASLNINNKGGLAAVFNWWLIAPELNEAWRGGHGGAEETAAVMSVNPNFVDMNSLEEMNVKDVSESLKGSGFKTISFKGVDISLPRNYKNVTDNGWIGKDHPKTATKQWGDEMLEATASYLAEFIEELKKVKL